MPAIPVYNSSGALVDEVEVPLMEQTAEAATYEAVVASLARQRAGTASTRRRSEVHGSTRKVWRQKGTGRARQGSRTAPHWKGGGVVFGPKPRSYRIRLPRKVRRLALRCAFSDCVEAGRVKVVQDLALERPSTKELLRLLDVLGLEDEVLIVADQISENLEKSARNAAGVRLLEPAGLNAYSVMRYPHLLFTRAGLEKFLAGPAFGSVQREPAE